MSKAEFQRVIDRYRKFGVIKGKELLLAVRYIANYLDDLEQVEGLVIMGLDGWFYVDGDHNKIAQDLSIDYYVGDDVMTSSEASVLSFASIRQYLSTLSATIPLISLTFDIPLEWIEEIFGSGN